MAKCDSEEEDYMSDAFLAKLEDTRPGLACGKQTKAYQIEAKIKVTNKKNQMKPKKIIEHEKREEGLNKSLGSENKGFALLSKMGYKPGMGIGKLGTGRTEPVRIDIKTGRGGLGKEAEQKRKKVEMDAMRVVMAVKRKKLESKNHDNFRASFREKMSEKEILRDLNKSQRVCRQLDIEQDVTKGLNKFFWPPEEPKQESPEEDVSLEDGYNNEINEIDESSDEDDVDNKQDEEEIDVPIADQLSVLTTYLRSHYLYCIWCGTKFDDTEDMDTNCPGNDAEAHR